MTISPTSSVVSNSAAYYHNALTPEALMIYLSTRLESVDGQIHELFQNQQDSEKVRAAIDQIGTLLNTLKENGEKETVLKGSKETLEEVKQIIENQIGPVNPKLAARMRTDLEQKGYILAGRESQYKTSQLEKTRDYLEDLTGQLESTAQMNMIRLQSLMSARQTAISLSTNLIAKLNDSTQKVVENIR